MKAMLLAAGRGERMRPLTDALPKPLLQAGGKPLIVWHLERLRAAGFRDIVINHAWQGEKLEQALGDGSALGLRIGYSREGQALETAGGIANARDLLGNAPFAVINGDVFTDYPFAALARAITMLTAPGSALCHLVLVENPPHHPAGDFCLQGHQVQENEGERLTFSGIGVYRPELFAAIAAGQPAPLAPLLREAMRQGQATGERYDGLWMDIGTPERLQELDGLLRQQAAGVGA